MALPTRLWLPDGVHELPTAVPAGQLAGLWPGSGSGALGGLPPVAAPSELPRLRRRALLRADAGLPERQVLIEWFPRTDLNLAEAERRKGACHVHLLRLHHVGLADARTAYAISEAPAGVDLLTVFRAAAGQLPTFWPVAVVAAAARGLLALHQHLQKRGGAAHGGIELHTLFVAWSGAVQLLAYSPPGQPGTPLLVAPEVRAGARLGTPAADVYALGAMLKALLPSAVLARGTLARLIRRCLALHAEERPALSALQAGLASVLGELDMPLGRATAIGEVLGRVCPRAATVDLADADWGDTALAGFPTLPATLSPLSPLSSGVVLLSPTWVMSPLDATVNSGDQLMPQRVEPPAPRPRRSGALLAATLGLLLLGGVALFRVASPPQVAPGPPKILRTAAPPSLNAPPVLSAPASVPLMPGAGSVGWGQLRLQIVHVFSEPQYLRLQLRLTNPTAHELPAELSVLTVGPNKGGERIAPDQPPPLLLGPGRTTVTTLSYPWPANSAKPPHDLLLHPTP